MLRDIRRPAFRGGKVDVVVFTAQIPRELKVLSQSEQLRQLLRAEVVENPPRPSRGPRSCRTACSAQSITDLFSDEVAAAAAKHAPDGDILTPEWRMWWKHMPDYSLVSPFECIAGDWGFASHDTYAGTLAGGTVLKLQEWDYIWTNEDGHVTRWDWFVDSGEWNPFLALIGLDPNGVTYQAYTVNYLREGGVGS